MGCILSTNKQSAKSKKIDESVSYFQTRFIYSIRNSSWKLSKNDHRVESRCCCWVS
jgi:hypothetical protein